MSLFRQETKLQIPSTFFTSTFLRLDVELLQDDHIFHSVTVSMGMMGVIYSAIIEVTDAYYLTENRTKLSWGDLKKKIPKLFAEEEEGKEEGREEGKLHR